MLARHCPRTSSRSERTRSSLRFKLELGWIRLLQLLSSAEPHLTLASHCSLSTSLRLLLSERSAYIQKKKSRLELFFNPPLDINMKSFCSEKKASCFFFFYTSAVRAKAQSSKFRGVRSSRIPPRIRPGAARHRVTDGPPGKAQAAESLTCRHRVKE